MAALTIKILADGRESSSSAVHEETMRRPAIVGIPHGPRNHILMFIVLSIHERYAHESMNIEVIAP